MKHSLTATYILNTSLTARKLAIGALLALIITSAFIARPAQAENTLFTAVYEGEYSNWDIKLTRKLIKNGNKYQLTSKMENLFASMEEISDFEIKNARAMPSQYHFQRKILGRKTTETLNFDWQTMQAVYTRDNKKKNEKLVNLKEGFLDPALYQLKLQADAANLSPTMDYQFIKRTSRKKYRFKPAESKTFTLDKKQYVADVVVYESGQSKKRTEVWLLPQLDYQIAKIIHRDKGGDTYSIDLKTYQAQHSAVLQFYQALKAPTDSAVKK